MSDKERKEVEQMVKDSMVGGRLSLSKLAELTGARIKYRIEHSGAKDDPITAEAGLAGQNGYLTDIYAKAQREVLGLVPKEQWHTDPDHPDRDFKPTFKLVTMNAPAKFDPDRKIVDQGYLFYDEATAKKINKAHLEADKQIGDARIFTSMATSASSLDGRTIDDAEKPKIESALQKFIAASKKNGGLDDYAKEQIAGELADLKHANITEADKVLGGEISELNALIAKKPAGKSANQR